MKTRNGLVSNSSTSSFLINTFLYSGIITTPVLAYWAIKHNRVAIRNFLSRIFKQKAEISN